MEVRIGVTHASREFTLDLNQSADDIKAQVSKALESNEPLLVFADERGRSICIPTDKLAYIEIAGEGRRLGFAR